MITESTPPFQIPPVIPSSGTEGALLLIAIVAGAALVGLILWFLWPEGDSPVISTDTPETDDAVERWMLRKDVTKIIECSRRLERKLEQANTNYLECAVVRDDWEGQAFKMQNERDRWRKECEDVSATLAEAFSERDNLNAEIARLRRAREE